MTEHLKSIEAEQAVLAVILMKPESLNEVTGFLEAAHFAEPLHAEIYGVMCRLSTEGRAVSPVTIAPFLAGWPPIGEMTASQYLGRIVVAAVSVSNIRASAQVVKDFADRRQLAGAGLRLQQMAAVYTTSAAHTAAEGVQELDTIIASAGTGRQSKVSLSESAEMFLDEMHSDKKAKPITTGLRDLDRVIGGWNRAQYHIVAARPSMGKSAKAVSYMLNAGRAGHSVMMFSLEMSHQELSARCLSEMVWGYGTPVPYADMLKGWVNQLQKERLYKASGQFRGLPIDIDDQGGLTIAEITARARQKAARLSQDGRKLDMIIVDHLGKIKASGRYAGNLVAETGEISQGLANLAKELDVAVIALAQLNRAVEGREDKHPTLSDLRNSGDLEQDAHLVSFLYRPSYYLERLKFDDPEKEATRLEKLDSKKHHFEIIIAKQRNGACTTVDCFSDMPNNVFRDLASDARGGAQ